MTAPDPRQAEELTRVPLPFWARLVSFMRHGESGRVVWHFAQGVPRVLETTSVIRPGSELSTPSK